MYLRICVFNIWYTGMSYLIALNPMLLKNMFGLLSTLYLCICKMCARCVQGVLNMWARCMHMSCLISYQKNLEESWRNLYMHAFSMLFMQKYCLVLFCIWNTEWKWKWIMNEYRQDCSKFENFGKLGFMNVIAHDKH